MTIAAVWYEEADKCIWVAADTRISRPSAHGGAFVSTDSGAKIHALPVICRPIPTTENFEPSSFFETAYGFVFAGSVTAATMTLATASTFTQSLQSYAGKLPPRLEEIARFVSQIGFRFSAEISQNNGAGAGDFEAAVFGKCPWSNKFEIFVFRCRSIASEQKFSTVENMLAPTVLGSPAAKGEFDRELMQLRKAGEACRLSKAAISQLLRGSSLLEVGGALSLGQASAQGFRLFWHPEPIVEGKPQARRAFNGIDLDMLGPVGPCIVGLAGMV